MSGNVPKETLYYQFPVSCFYWQDSFRDQLENASAFALCNFGRVLHLGLVAEHEHEVCPAGEADRIVKRWMRDEQSPDFTKHWNDPSWEEIEVVLAANKYKVVTIPHANVQREGLIRRRDFGTRLVRLRRDLMHDAYFRRAFKQIDFQVLCGVYSAIGSRQMAIVRNEVLRSICIGYNDSKQAPSSEHKMMPPRMKVSRSLERLAKRGLFARFCPNKRDYYYSIRMTPEQMCDELVRRELNKNQPDAKAMREQFLERIKIEQSKDDPHQ